MKKALLIVVFLGWLPSVVLAQKIRVAVAANAQYVAKKLKDAFEKESGVQTELVVGSSGKLTAQIKAGAPFDVFLSADTQYPEALQEAGLTLESPRVYAYGKLVFWSVKKMAMLPFLTDQKTSFPYAYTRETGFLVGKEDGHAALPC